MSSLNVSTDPITLPGGLSAESKNLTGVSLFTSIKFNATFAPEGTAYTIVTFRNPDGSNFPNIKGIFISHFNNCGGQAECIWSFAGLNGNSVTLYSHNSLNRNWEAHGDMILQLILE